MRIIELEFNKSQHIHLRVLKKLLEEKKVKNPLMFEDQIEDVYALLITKAQNILSPASIRVALHLKHSGNLTDYEIIDLRMKHMEFRAFLMRISKLKAFAKMVEDCENTSDALIKAMFRIAEKKAQKEKLEELQKAGEAPTAARKGFMGSPSDIEENDLNDMPPEIQQQIQDAFDDIVDFSASFDLLNDALDGIDDLPPQGGRGFRSLQDSSMWEDRVRWLADNFSLRHTHIYNMARDLEIAIETQTKTNHYKRAEDLANIQNIDVEQSKDMTKATPVEMCKDDDEFFGKMAKGELQTRVFEESTEKKQCLYVLGDCSGSMLGRKQNMMASVIVALCKKTAQNGDIFFLRLFNDGCHEKQDVLTKGMAGKVEQYIVNTGYAGGGTNIPKALTTAINDIIKAEQSQKHLLSKAKILLLTDAEDGGGSMHDVGNCLKDHNIELHTVVIGRKHNQMGGLEAISKTFKFASVDKAGCMSIVDNVIV